MKLILTKMANIRHRACAQACKGVPIMLGIGLGLGLGLGRGVWSVLKNLDLGGRALHPPP